MNNFCSAIFVPPYCSTVCSTVFVPLTFLYLHLGSLSPNGREFPTNFCSTIFVLLTFLFTCTWGTPSPNGQEYPPIFVLPDRCYPFKVQTLNEQSLCNIPFCTYLIFVPQFLFQLKIFFCSTVFVLLFPFSRILFNHFCTLAIFVPLTFLHLHLGSPIFSTIFVPQSPHQFLFR